MKKMRFTQLAESARQASAYARGEADASQYRISVPSQIDIRAIRKKFGLTQEEFAARFGFNVARLRDWEQGRSQPDGALRAYLMVIHRRPDAVQEALAA